MKREQLVELGLSEEQVNSVMSMYGQSVQEVKTKLATAEQTRDDLKEQLTERDKDLSKMKKDFSDNENLKVKFEELQSSYKSLQEQSEKNIQKIERDSELNQILSEFKPKNAKAVRALLDDEKITFENGQLSGVKEQLEALKESDAYLFDLGKTQGSYKPNGGGNPNSFNTNLAEAMKDPDFNMTEWVKQKQKLNVN